MTKSTGICIGASSIKIVEIDSDYRITDHSVRYHDCNPKNALAEIVPSLDLANSYVAVTGRKFKNLLNLPDITEPEASEAALRRMDGKGQTFNALVSLGSENFIVYILDRERGITQVKTGNKCASGTGEFFLQQIRRMGVGIDEAVDLAVSSEPHHVSGRCSVFCKSDCTHALNRGTPLGEVCSGLSEMMADKVIELLHSTPRKDIVLVGGVTKNDSVVKKLRSKIQDLHIPEEAEYFEAWGAAIHALENQTSADGAVEVRQEVSSFSTLPPLKDFKDWVEFKEDQPGVAQWGDECILGLDVGSTTTKAVLVRTEDDAVLASIYLRTNGNPVRASRECYKSIHEQLHGTEVRITGLGVCGSGRKIAGLHALTDGIINEIIAHATGAAYYDPEVDTILEIGGQDAKYTYLVNGVPCDYAMNEACSAGTGSFLEEAAKESLAIDYLDIHEIAMEGTAPPNFNDQCAAFISSDIKNAGHEDIPREDIVAGLVYSICMNYTNRVKGPRKVGEKVFMQGGVCYNGAVPLAMASLLKKPIVVPPEPGLIGAFGVALEVKNRVANGLMEPADFDLKELMDREVEYGKNFACPGVPEDCDRACRINVIRMNGKNHAFGGICNKYYNIQHRISVNPSDLDYVAMRQDLLFGLGDGMGIVGGNGSGDAARPVAETDSGKGKGTTAFWTGELLPKNRLPLITTPPKTIGLQRSFYLHNLFPLFQTFFTDLGLEVLIAEEVDPEGAKLATSSFCYPGEIAFGMFQDLLNKKPDVIFLPKVAQMYVEKSKATGWAKHSTCCLAANEPFYLRSCFRDIPVPVLTPVFEFHQGWDAMEAEFVELGEELGKDAEASAAAYHNGVAALRRFTQDKKALGIEVLRKLEEDPNAIAIALFGRAYNTFADEANFGIPRKFASRGVYVLPYECLPSEDEESIENMSWAQGHEIIRGARYVKKHPQLFSAFVTNFSCGPDSFLVAYVRDIMGNKPSLTLELDNHTADAGVNTRIEAFLDIIQRYLALGVEDAPVPDFTPSKLEGRDGEWFFVDSDAQDHNMRNQNVTMLIPSMGRISAGLSAASFRGMGIHAKALKTPDFPTLMIGRANTSCKECIPLILTTAGLLDYVDTEKKPEEKVAFFMPIATGSCRLAQYVTFQQRLIRKKELRDVAMFSLATEDNYEGMKFKDYVALFKAIIAADVLDEVSNALLVLPKDKEAARDLFESHLQLLVENLESGGKGFFRVMNRMAKELAKIELRFPLKDAKKVLLDGEIYVRKDEFTSHGVVERLAKKDIVTKRAPFLEWLLFTGYNTRYLQRRKAGRGARRAALIQTELLKHFERKTKKILARSGLYEPHIIDIESVLRDGNRFVDTTIIGEIILIIGSFFQAVAHEVHGVIHVGPFACLPTRIIESILTPESKVEGNNRIQELTNYHNLAKHHVLPHVSVEIDGNPLPQVVEARIEAFALQVEKMHEKMNGGAQVLH